MFLFLTRQRAIQYGRGALKVARVAAYFAFVQLVFLGIGVRTVRGAARKTGLQMGSELLAMGDVMGASSYRVLLNGESVNLSSGTTDETIGAVMDRVEGECRAHSGGLEGALAARLPRSLSSTLPPEAMGILREQSAARGFVGCFIRDGDDGLAGLKRAVTDFASTKDLRSLGALHYVMAQRAEGGKTHVVTVGTGGSFRLESMFPPSGDAPGPDPGAAVRPPDARRVLTASVEGSPFSVQVFDSGAAVDATLAHYDSAMIADGWQVVPLGDDAQSRGATQRMRSFTREGVDLIISVKAGAGGRTVVAVASMPPR